MMIITKSNYIPHSPRIVVGYDYKLSTNEAFDTLPAWSLHRLLSLYNQDYTIKELYNGEEVYDMLICAMQIAIEDGEFNEEYLKTDK